MILMRFSNDLLTMSFWRSRRRRLRDFSCIPWFPPAFERRTRPDPVTRNRFAAARFVFILGTGGSLSALSWAARRRALSGRRRSGGRIFEANPRFCQGSGSECTSAPRLLAALHQVAPRLQDGHVRRRVHDPSDEHLPVARDGDGRRAQNFPGGHRGGGARGVDQENRRVYGLAAAL